MTDEFIERNHTTASFYNPFINDSDSINISYRTRKTDGWEITSKEQLHYCKDCLNEQFINYGEGYWCRKFQIPGNMICTKHKKYLSRHPINIVEGASNKLLIPDRSLTQSVNYEKYTQYILDKLRLPRCFAPSAS